MCTVKTQIATGLSLFIMIAIIIIIFVFPLIHFLYNYIHVLLDWRHDCFQAGAKYMRIYPASPYAFNTTWDL